MLKVNRLEEHRVHSKSIVCSRSLSFDQSSYIHPHTHIIYIYTIKRESTILIRAAVREWSTAISDIWKVKIKCRRDTRNALCVCPVCCIVFICIYIYRFLYTTLSINFHSSAMFSQIPNASTSVQLFTKESSFLCYIESLIHYTQYMYRLRLVIVALRESEPKTAPVLAIVSFISFWTLYFIFSSFLLWISRYRLIDRWRTWRCTHSRITRVSLDPFLSRKFSDFVRERASWWIREWTEKFCWVVDFGGKSAWNNARPKLKRPKLTNVTRAEWTE